MKLKWPKLITSETKPVGLEPPPYSSVGECVEQSYEVFSVVDIVIKPDKNHNEGYRVFLGT